LRGDGVAVERRAGATAAAVTRRAVAVGCAGRTGVARGCAVTVGRDRAVGAAGRRVLDRLTDAARSVAVATGAGSGVARDVGVGAGAGAASAGDGSGAGTGSWAVAGAAQAAAAMSATIPTPRLAPDKTFATDCNSHRPPKVEEERSPVRRTGQRSTFVQRTNEEVVARRQTDA